MLLIQVSACARLPPANCKTSHPVREGSTHKRGKSYFLLEEEILSSKLLDADSFRWKVWLNLNDKSDSQYHLLDLSGAAYQKMPHLFRNFHSTQHPIL